MRRPRHTAGLACLALIIACSGGLKATVALPEKCNRWPGHAWRFDHTIYWTGQIGTTTVQHSRDVYSCQARR